MKICFTGTRKGLSDAQKRDLAGLLESHQDTALMEAPEATLPILIHGGAIGADAEAHHVAKKLGLAIEVYPAFDAPWSLPAWEQADVVHPADLPLKRNREMVRQADLVIACPSSKNEVLRSGTWATVRYARQIRRPLTIIYPDGSQE